MGRVLVLVLLVVLVVWLIRRALRAPSRPGSPEAPPQARPPLESELISCARCGLNLPRAEAREAAGVLYCSDEHARLGKA